MVLSTATITVGFALWASAAIVGMSTILMRGFVGVSRRTIAVLGPRTLRTRSGFVVSTWWTIISPLVAKYLSRRFVPP